MEDKQRLNSLEVALHNEVAERDYYLKHASKTTNPVGKAMFEEIAADELEHYNRLKELHEKWIKAEKWPETVPMEVKKTKIAGILKQTLKQVDDMPDVHDDDIKAIETAIAFEEKGVDLYSRLSNESNDPKEKAFFKLLSDIEREHFVSLRDMEEYLKDPQSWFVKSEHQGFDGA
ncbi:MAG TPA: hypothetical protein ENN05_11500 [Deltaproteobacteria bacterium]|nr:hypothetical protein [Deltaproteobacteria bacterium]